MTTELIQELKSTFDYHSDGYLIRRSTGKPCGQRANNGNGYVRVRVGKRLLLVHRVIYALAHGVMPMEVDHISGNRADNRIENLRDVSHLENLHNSKKRNTNTSGFAGVHWDARDQKWRAQICVDGRQIHLGYFNDYDDAVQARKLAKIKHHPTSPEAAEFTSESF